MAETVLTGLAVFAMVFILFVSFIPFVPGPILMWLVTLVYGFLTQFDRLSLPVFAVISVIMLLAITSDLWLPVLGMRTEGTSCWGIVGTILGGIFGTFFIPIPICGTVIGSILGGMTFEYMHIRDARYALKAGRLAVKAMIYGYIVEFIANVSMMAVFLLTLYLTG